MINKVSPTIVDVVLPSNTSPMSKSLPYEPPMEMDLHDGDGKKIAVKEKMLHEVYKASNFATKMETDDSEPILGKRGRVDGLNSSKKNMEQIKKKTREQEKGRREARSP